MTTPPGGSPQAPDFETGASSALARCISAEVRARMAALRVSGRQLSASTGIKHNYLAERLRDAKPFTLDDLDRILAVWDIDGPEFVRTAYDNHYERIWVEAEDIRRSASRGYELAAHDDEQHSIEDEQGGDEFP